MASLFYGAGKDRAEYDYYATPPKAVEELLRLEQFSRRIWEPCCGGGHIAEVLKKHGHSVRATDLVDHGYGIAGIDFLACSQTEDEDIITNPPYIQAQAFVEHALQFLTPGHKLAMFMRLSFLETKARKALFLTTPPRRVYVASSRFGCAKNGEFLTRPNGELYYPSTVAYAWFVWEHGFTGTPELHWFN